MERQEIKRILIIDDETRLRGVYTRVIQSIGLSVHEAADAWEATDVLIKERIDLVLLDIRMPEVDGREMFDVLREHAPQIKVMVMSVYSEDEQKQLIPHAGDYFDKSKGSLQLIERISNLLLNNLSK